MNNRFACTLILFVCGITPCVCQESQTTPQPLAANEQPAPSPTDGFAIEQNEHGVTVSLNGEVFVGYRIDDVNKPYLWPIVGPRGKDMTRTYPMKDVDHEPKKQRDHPHHRGMTFGHEHVVFGTEQADTWHEWITFGGQQKGPGNAPSTNPRIKHIGKIVHREFTVLNADHHKAVVEEILDHVSPSGTGMLTEVRRMTFRVEPVGRIIDFDQVLTASAGEVKLHDSKDAGLSIRVPTNMAVDSRMGGKIVNSKGDRDRNAWSQPAKWCDYFGSIDGEQAGIAFLNHPSSYRFPTRWHVRSYGLFTANPFAMKSFDGSLPDGTTTLSPGEELNLHHRLIFHNGHPRGADGKTDVGRENEVDIEQAWRQYAQTVRP
ncbi:MAG: PmoA family protein [Rhodopirellula sp. JB053]